MQYFKWDIMSAPLFLLQTTGLYWCMKSHTLIPLPQPPPTHTHTPTCFKFNWKNHHILGDIFLPYTSLHWDIRSHTPPATPLIHTPSISTYFYFGRMSQNISGNISTFFFQTMGLYGHMGSHIPHPTSINSFSMFYLLLIWQNEPEYPWGHTHVPSTHCPPLAHGKSQSVTEI